MSLRTLFSGVNLEVEDLFLLEAFQIGYLPHWVPERDFAAVLWAYPAIHRFLTHKHRPVVSYLEQLLARFQPMLTKEELETCADNVVWTIADLPVYNKCPGLYDNVGFHRITAPSTRPGLLQDTQYVETRNPGDILITVAMLHQPADHIRHHLARVLQPLDIFHLLEGRASVR